MQVNPLSNNNFEGKVHFSPNLPNSMKKYANTILDTVIEGKSIREKLAEKTYDLTFFTTSSKKAINPKLEFYSGFKVSNPKDKKYYNARIRMNDDFYTNAKRVAKFIDNMEDYKAWYDGYNTLAERLKIWFRNTILS